MKIDLHKKQGTYVIIYIATVQQVDAIPATVHVIQKGKIQS